MPAINEQLNLNDAIDGNLVAKKRTLTFVDIVFHDLKPATKQLFQAAWCNGTPNTAIVPNRA